MIVLSDKYSLFIKINDDLFDDTKGNFVSLTIHESLNQAVPTFSLDIADTGYLLDRGHLYDGAKIKIALATGVREVVSEDEYMEFLLQNVTLHFTGDRNVFRLKGILDAPEYIIHAARYAVNGTSCDVALEIANRSEMSFDGDTSNDLQIWINPGMTNYRFLQRTAAHAYNSEKSCYVFGVTRKKLLRYYNLDRRIAKPVVWHIYHGDIRGSKKEADTFSVEEIRPVISSGVENKFFGYGVEAHQFDVASGIPSTISYSQINPSTRYTNLNRDLTKPSKVLKLPIGSGNTHSNYDKALVQNTRIRSWYSTKIETSTTNPFQVDILDRVELFSHVLPDGHEPTHSGNYFVDRKVTFIDEGVQFAKFSLTREGHNSDAQITQVYG